MSKEKPNIEQLFKQKFDHFEVQPSERVWKRVNSSLLRRHFMQFNLDSFNIYYLSAIIIAGALTVLSVTHEKPGLKDPGGAYPSGIESTTDESQVILEPAGQGTNPRKSTTRPEDQNNFDEKK